MAGHLLCIAIPVPEPWGSVIDTARQRLQPGRRHMAAHITVIPPFRVTSEELAPLIDDVARDLAACYPFALELRGTANFAGAQGTVYLRVVAGSPECESLRDRLLDGLGEHVCPDSSRHPMVPHVTLVNRADAATMERAATAFDGFEARFRVDRLCVYEHGADGWAIITTAGFLDTFA